MKNLNLIFALALSIITSVSFASNGNFFVVEQEGENLVMFLNVENPAEIASISISGDYSVNGVADNLNVFISSSEVSNFNQGLAKVQSLNTNFDFASYNLTITNKNGEVLTYPSVVLESNVFHLAKN